jgi:hypothetical protein
MQCDRLISLVKNWYLKVQEEAMAPARMVAFMEQHIAQCEECLADPDVREETDKIREIVLPPSKVPKQKAERAVEKEAEVVDEEVEEDEDTAETDDDDEEEDTDSFDPDLMDEEEEI